VSRKHDAHLVSGELKAEAMPELGAKASVRELETKL
jgi:hypothetical protein